MAEPVFQPLPTVPDHPALEEEILARWERRGPSSSCASRTAAARVLVHRRPGHCEQQPGVHTAWGRTLKDVFQRYKAMQGFDQRYQNGFDCQGLWIEVEVEHALGLNSKHEIEEYGLDRVRPQVPRARRPVGEGS